MGTTLAESPGVTKGAEIADTESAEYRSGLKEKKRTVMSIVERLRKIAE